MIMNAFKRICLGIVILGAFCALENADVKAITVTPWVDLWGDTAQLNNHFENGFAQGRRPALLLRMTGRVGIRIPSGDPSTVLMPYLVTTSNYSVDSNFWNNIYATGYGIRIFPFLTFPVQDPRMAWIPDTRIYWEQLHANYFKDRDTASTNASRDDRIGVEIWHEWNERDPGKPMSSFDREDAWTELWGDISYRETNFSNLPFRNTVAALQIRRGFYLNAASGILEPYGVLNAVSSGMPDYFLNNVNFGFGIRFHPLRFQSDIRGVAHLAAKGRIFVEILSITYLKNRPPAGTPNADFRFGVELALGR